MGKRAPGRIFCMSGPVANVDDDKDQIHVAVQKHDEVPSSHMFFSDRGKTSIIVASDGLKTESSLCEIFASNGDVYVGSLQGFFPDGMGKYLWSDGCMYEGEWSRGKESGKGKTSWPSGATYEGDFCGGYMHGMGSFTSIDGTTYKGNWKMNEKHGFGSKSYANGDAYEGSWNGGVPEGLGRYVWKNGSEYVGDWRGGTMSGRGILTWANGDTFDGHWLEGLQHGHGVYTWADGSSFVGNWIGGLKDGKGIFYPPGILGNITFSGRHRNRRNCLLEQQETTMFPVVEREYVHGVLINELVFENLTSSFIKPQKRWHRRHAKELKRPGVTIYKGHRSYDLMLKLQLGIRYTVGRVTPESKRNLCPADFGPKARIWLDFPREGSQLTPPHQSSDFKWKDYCPVVFRHLREMFRIDAADYMLSVCGNDGLRELSSPGKSGSVFYLSDDDRFIIKTIRKYEVKSLLQMLPKYYNHVRTNENTLITKFFGLHRVKPVGGEKVRFVVMGNMFCTELCIHHRFDLKGSSQGRSTEKMQIDETTTLKDLDLDYVFHLEPSWRDALLRQIACDCEFLVHERIMDYSILLGVHIRGSQFPTTSSATHASITSSCSNSATPQLSSSASFALEEMASRSLVLVAHEPGQGRSTSCSHVRGSPLRAFVAAAGDKEVDLLLPGTTRRLRVQLGVNMPGRAERKVHTQDDDSHPDGFSFDEVQDVVLYLGIIDILQEYDMGKKLEHAFKAFQFDALSISAVDPGHYAKRFQDSIQKIFPPISSKV